MSRFFRSADSSGSESDSSDSGRESEAALPAQDVALRGLPSQSHALGPNTTANGKEWLLHSLLEERCLNQVRAEHTSAHRTEPEVRQEAARRYRALVARLAPLKMVSAGPEDDRHGVVRQSVRDILDSVDLNDTQAIRTVSRDATRVEARNSAAVPLRRILPQGGSSVMPSSPVATMLLDSLGIFNQPTIRTRYSADFVELGPLGKGGYGEVFRVRHHLDQREYAVKKVRIRPSMVSRMRTEGKGAADEALAEIQTLSRLDHPNVVRYFSSWIEWSSPEQMATQRSNLGSSREDAEIGAEVSTLLSRSLHRVRTESDELTRDMFESRSQCSDNRSVSAASVNIEDLTSASLTGAELMEDWGPTPTLHMQMDVYPMTLADFIAPGTSRSGILPLSHCFHLETSIQILLAIIEGVEYLHSKEIVHRDLKPANIFLKHEDTPRAANTVDLLLCSECRREGKPQPAKLSVRIGDFGLVTNLAEQQGNTSSLGAAGTELYRPKTSSVGPQLDIHAVGVIACELLCRFNTQFERRDTLYKLRDGCLPDDFPNCAETQSNKVKSCITAMLDHGEGQMPIEEIKHRLSSLTEPQSLIAPRVNDEVSRRSST
ncbi:hypothetical protein DOTSEDRAFT_74400 [Dothistroma septosporum NZE10]|uniref:non-specific serine/threonine protein kinase n=1 Tax=Dothistroma septosporum (strain NZE10 / CBS 128990) TaxID=675120 RepID=N1PHN4_DOTSN|nr:hypothetical protein DOTSEDRAFT_74400 [Dothistroma septosporum NZE10]